MVCVERCWQCWRPLCSLDALDRVAMTPADRWLVWWIRATTVSTIRVATFVALVTGISRNVVSDQSNCDTRICPLGIPSLTTITSPANIREASGAVIAVCPSVRFLTVPSPSVRLPSVRPRRVVPFLPVVWFRLVRCHPVVQSRRTVRSPSISTTICLKQRMPIWKKPSISGILTRFITATPGLPTRHLSLPDVMLR